MFALHSLKQLACLCGQGPSLVLLRYQGRQTIKVIKDKVSGVIKTQEFKSQYYFFLAEWPHICYLRSLSFSFLLSKLGIPIHIP